MRVQDARLIMSNYVALSTSQFVGRQHELALIWNQYKVASNGSARVMLLCGEPGIGKTRLMEEFTTLAEDDGATILRGSASDFEVMPPYLPFLEALGQYIRITPLDRLREQVVTAPQILASILPELAIRLGELPAAYQIPPEQAQLRLYEAIGTFLEAISTSKVLVLMLDDLHLADVASLYLLCHIMRHQSNARLLVLGTYREEEIDRTPALSRAMNELARLRALTTIVLTPLSAQEVEALAVSYLGGPISPNVSQLLYTQSEGNPFFAEELIRGWIEEGSLVLENTHWVALAPLERALPSSIVGALRQRFARLSSDIIDHLRVAATIGRTFEPSLLSTVEDQNVEVVEERLLVAERAGLVRTGPTGLFKFSHEKIRECLYAEVSVSRRRRLHEVIGHALESRYNQESTKSAYQLAELAFHFANSSDRKRGATYARQAAEQALQSFAFKEAMVHYRMALELHDTDDVERGYLLLGLGEAALLVGEESEAAIAYQAALTWFSQAGDVQAAARATHGLGLALWRQQALEAARTALEHALSLLENSDSAQVVRVLVDLATLLTIYMGEQAKGSAYAQLAMEMARRLEDRRLEASVIRAVVGKLNLFGNDIPGAILSMEQALAIVEADDDPSEAAKCCLYLAGAYYFMGEIKRSYEVISRCIEYIERFRQPYQLRNTYSWLALLHSSQGAWTEAEQAIEHAQLQVDHLSNRASVAFLHQVRGFLAYQREDYLTAEQEFKAVMVNQRRDAGGLMLQAGLLGLVQAALGKRDDAFAYIAKLQTLLAEQPTGTLPAAPIITCLALIAIAVGDQELAAELYPRLLRFRGQLYWFFVDRVLGMIATLRRNWEMATMHLAEAEATARRENLHPELARTLLGQADLELARSGPERLTRATKLLRDAQALFKELKMTQQLEQVHARLRSLSHPKKGLATQSQSLPANLTRREAQVLQLVAKGKSNSQIAQELGLSAKTVANHLTRIFNKTLCENRAAAAAFAVQHSLA
jgi:predicted ATPase/DNA-binding CsgD family transcriptional regulator